MSAPPLISVVIATKNREQLLADTLDALVGQRWARHGYDVLIADNGSTDGTRHVIERAERRGGAPRAR